MDDTKNIQFSQTSLQDFKDCKRRFQLKYLMKLAWPAIETQPAKIHERYLQRAARFHHMVHQNQLGIQASRLEKLTAEDELLKSWWSNYLIFKNSLEEKNAYYYPELLLQTSINDHRLIAKYDLLIIKPSEFATIIDWKTSRKRPKRSWLSKRLQSRIYPYVIVKASAYLNNGVHFKPEQVEMIYWYANFPNEPINFKYNSEKYDADHEHLSALISEIVQTTDDIFTLTEDYIKCKFCTYRSLCDRGVVAGFFEDQEQIQEYSDEADLDIIFDQIAEIEF
ncbi:MAG: PD-(D/E)XK nuclease family protein [Anaerolineales bacterium]|jgi:CRISPR/Cas system-associated exonuclease Cas4 (RecB family)